MSKLTFTQRADLIRMVISPLANQNFSVGLGRIAIHAALEGSDIDSPTALSITLPNYIRASRNDLALLDHLADAVEKHTGGSFAASFSELSSTRALLGY